MKCCSLCASCILYCLEKNNSSLLVLIVISNANVSQSGRISGGIVFIVLSVFVYVYEVSQKVMVISLKWPNPDVFFHLLNNVDNAFCNAMGRLT